MKVLVDTCVWSLALARHRPDPSPAVDELRRLITDGEDVLLPGIVLQELLQGVRSTKQHDRLFRVLAPFRLVMATRDDHQLAAGLYRDCRTRGIAVGTVDALIAALALRESASILTVDEDFVRLAPVAGLRLLRPWAE